VTPPYTPPRLPVVPYSEERPELKEIPFTVQPKVKFNPYGATITDHDVKLKSPFEDQVTLGINLMDDFFPKVEFEVFNLYEKQKA
jgi:hypothetical protein